MNASIPPELLTRREAIRRTAAWLGLAATPSLLEGILAAQTAPATTAPAYLDRAQYAAAAAVAERILPRTDTPGASDAGVPAFLDLMYGRYLTADEQRMFAAGLADLDVRGRARGTKSFAELAPEAQDEILRQVAAASQALEKSFFQQIRDLTLVGYFTSEPVGRNVLHYDPVPGPFQSCIPLSDVGNKAWTR